jgi:hypothetical protein
VKMAEDRGVPLSSLSVADLQSIHPDFADDVVKVGSCMRVVVGWWWGGGCESVAWGKGHFSVADLQSIHPDFADDVVKVGFVIRPKAEGGGGGVGED